MNVSVNFILEVDMILILKNHMAFSVLLRITLNILSMLCSTVKEIFWTILIFLKGMISEVKDKEPPETLSLWTITI